VCRPLGSPERGFTLLEVMIVVVIMGIAAAIVAPTMQAGLRARELRSSVRTIAGALRGMQIDAVRTGKVQTLLLSPTRTDLVLTNGDRMVDLGEVARIRSVRGGEYRPTGELQVNFYPNGSTSGLALLIGDREAPGDAGFVIRVDPLIGLVTVRDASH